MLRLKAYYTRQLHFSHTSPSLKSRNKTAAFLYPSIEKKRKSFDCNLQVCLTKVENNKMTKQCYIGAQDCYDKQAQYFTDPNKEYDCCSSSLCNSGYKSKYPISRLGHEL